MKKIDPGWYFLYHLDDKDTFIIIKKPNKYSLDKLNDEIEQTLLDNLIYPSVIDVLKLLNTYPTLASDILAELNRKKDVSITDYDEITITESSEIPNEPPPEPFSIQNDPYEITFDLA
ncbi:MAG: hypothetical protein EKK57_11240 [Proteobacteria bacterium]|nr:MAG: hypothetical protein EKK57_11240 [Pseudomonadota bacterium]